MISVKHKKACGAENTSFKIHVPIVCTKYSGHPGNHVMDTERAYAEWWVEGSVVHTEKLITR